MKLGILLALAAAVPALSQPTTTTVYSVLNGPDGRPYEGEVYISINAYCTSPPSSNFIFGGPANTVHVRNGVLQVALVPNDTCVPNNRFYNVSYSLNTQDRKAVPRNNERWYVTYSPSPVSLQSVIQSSSASLPSAVTFAISQLTGATYKQVLYGNNAGSVVSSSGLTFDPTNNSLTVSGPIFAQLSDTVNSVMTKGASPIIPGNCLTTDSSKRIISAPDPCGTGSGGGGTGAALWYTYDVTKIANGVSGCATANGCWQVGSGTPVGATGATSQTVSLVVKPAGAVVMGSIISPTSACTGGGATYSTLGIGSNSTTTSFYASPYSIFSPASSTNFQTTSELKTGNTTLAEQITFTIASDVNVDTISNGCQIRVYLAFSTLDNSGSGGSMGGDTTVPTNSGAGAQILKTSTNVVARTMVCSGSVTCTADTDTIQVVGSGGGGGGGSPNPSQSFVSQTSVTINHGLGTLNTITACYNASNQQIGMDSVTISDANNVVVTFSIAQTGRCVVNGNGGSGGGGGGGAITSGMIGLGLWIDGDGLLAVDPLAVPTFLTGTGSLDFPSIAANNCSELTFSLPGAAITDSVQPGWPASLDSGLMGTMWVSATDTIKVRLCKVTAGSTSDPSATNYRATITRSF